MISIVFFVKHKQCPKLTGSTIGHNGEPGRGPEGAVAWVLLALVVFIHAIAVVSNRFFYISDSNFSISCNNRSVFLNFLSYRCLFVHKVRGKPIPKIKIISIEKSFKF